MEETEAKKAIRAYKKEYGKDYRKFIDQMLSKSVMERDSEMIDYWSSIKKLS